MKKLPLLLALALLLVPFATIATPGARAQGDGTISDFQAIAPGHGWLLFSGGLFWTNDNGATWQDITPPLTGSEALWAVDFADVSLGRALIGDGQAFALETSVDGGQNWARQPLGLPGLADSPAQPAAAFMGWLDQTHGWLVFRLASGSSFSLGMLFTTGDGGQTWQSRTIPIGEPASFSGPLTGWTAGGAAGNELYRTTDGGQTWGLVQPAGSSVHYLLPKFADDQNGLVTVIAADGDAARADFYRTTDGGQTWALAGSQPLAANTPISNDLPLSLLNSTDFVLSVPQSDQILRSAGLQLQDLTNTDGASADISILRMATLDAGWAQSDSGTCTPASNGGLDCARETKLLSTQDGGLTWQVVPLPLNAGTSVAESFAVADKSADSEAVSSLDADTQPYAGQGFDKCGLPGLASMQTWWNGSPYNGFNLYIGGSAYACRNTLPTASYVSTLNAQGWRFFPTWVGPQAPCMPYASVFSYNTTTAYNQGVAEADAALTVATNLGLAAPDMSGTIIYYDMETYSVSDTSCRNAVKSFLSGWTHELRAHNNLAGVYGNSCYNVTDWSTIANVPDAVWLAHWFSNPAYLPTASTVDSCMSGTLWSNHQRLRQYAGDHTEVWGGVSLGGIDSNALDGPLTVVNGTANASVPSTPIAANPLPNASVPRGTDTWLTWKTTGDSCTVHAWGNGLDVTSGGICSIYHLGPRLPGYYAWQVTSSNAVGTTIGAIWQFGVAPAVPGTLSATPAGSSHANLTWILSSDDPTYVDGYRIYADGALAGTVARGVNSFQVANLSCNITHSFYVTATWQGIASGPGNVASVSTPLCAPPLLSPGDGSTPFSLRPTFSWQAIPGATGYRLQVSQLPDFSNLVVNVVLSGTSYTVPADLPPTTLFYWKARSINSTGNSDWSPVRSFTTPQPPPVPGLVSPGVNALVTDYTPVLVWSEPNLPTGTLVDHYQVQLDTSSGFPAPLYDQVTTATQFEVPANLKSNAVYYWRVRAYNSQQQYTDWAGTWYFRSAITPPTLVDPPVGTHLKTRRLTLDWSDVAGASSYGVQFSFVPDFSTLLSTAGPTPSTFTVTSDLPANRLIYWRVKAKGANGPSLWSEAWSFTTGNPPSIPSLQYPANGALLTLYQFTFNWSDSSLPLGTTLDHYQMQLATDSAFSALVYDESTQASQFALPAPLTPNTRYYWRVRAFNTDGDYSTWSSTRYLKAAILPPVPVAPVSGTPLVTLRLSLDWDDVVGASNYTIRISRYPNFSPVLRSATIAGSQYSVSPDLPANTILYWDVRANGANGPSLWSPTWSFQTGNPPSVPSLLSPANNILLTYYQPTLDWSDSTLPLGTTLDHYQVQVATDTAFSAVVQDVNTPVSRLPLPSPLAPNDIYYWRVRAFNNNGHFSTWSGVRSLRAAILPPTLLLPNPADVPGTRRPSFDWNDVAGATGYTIQVSRYSNFSTNLLSANVGASAYTSGVNLPTGITLYWRVRANGPLGPSLWAEAPARTFKIVLP